MKTELKVIATVAVVFLATEIGMRLFQDKLSIDITHINSIPSVSEEVAQPSKPDEIRVLFVGNSLTRSGVDDPMFCEKLSHEGIKVRTHYIYPDGSSVNLWSFMVRNNFADAEKLPDVMVVGFGATHLRDLIEDPTKLASYASFSDIGKMAREIATDFDDIAEFALAKSSVAYKHRRRVQPRVFTKLLPYYLESYRRLNDVRNNRQKKDDGEDGPEDIRENHTFDRLRELLEATTDNGVTVVFVSLPMFEPYEVPDEALSLIKSKGASYLDLRDLSLSPEDFDEDEYHLGESGAERFTRSLVDQLVKILGER